MTSRTLHDNTLSDGHLKLSHWATVVVVVMSVLMTLTGNAEPPPEFYVAYFTLAALYLGVMLELETRLEGTRWGLMVYFAVLLTLAGALFLLAAQQRIHGMLWLILMPVVGLARGHLSWSKAILVCLACLAMMGGHLYLLTGWREVPAAVAAQSTAVFFVLVFTEIALREREARAESQRLGVELQAANDKLANYAVQAEELATARERTRVAREIHDSVGHVLTALNMQLEASRAMFERDPETARDSLGKAQGLARQGLSEIRRSVADLRAGPLEGRTLEEVVSELTERNNEAGLATRFEVLGEARELEPRASLTLYRTAQEGLTNTLKHSQAKQVDVVLDYRQGAVRLEIRDDGLGREDSEDNHEAKEQKTRGGFGLLGVRERVRQLDGQFEVRSSPGEGLTLAVEIPA